MKPSTRPSCGPLQIESTNFSATNLIHIDTGLDTNFILVQKSTKLVACKFQGSRRETMSVTQTARDIEAKSRGGWTAEPSRGSEERQAEWDRRRHDRPPVLKVHELSKAFGAVRILNGVTFEMAEGEVISLVGASGSGKSTLLRCINFLETPTSGRIEVTGDAISITSSGRGKSEITNAAKIPIFRKRTGMVFQNFNLWPHRTVIGNVTEALAYVLGKAKREAEDMALSALSKVGMAEFRDRYPSQLSGGQQQRVAIARVLAMRPKIMLFDEPTSALDPELVGEVLKVIRTLAEEGATILLVTHEMRFARDVSNRMIFLRKGILEQDDAPEELFRSPASEAVKRFLSSVMPAAA